MRWGSGEEKANEAWWTRKCDTCERNPGRRNDEFLRAGPDVFTFLWEWKLAADPSPLSVLNIWADSGLAYKNCVPLYFSQFLALLISYVSSCSGGRWILFEVVQFENSYMGIVSGLSQVSGELLLGSVPVINMAQCPALLAGSKMQKHLSPFYLCQSSRIQKTRMMSGYFGCSKHVHMVTYFI